MSTHEAPVTQTDRDTQKHSRSATRGWWVAEFVDDPDEVVVGIETDRGLWVHALAATGYQLYAINPLAVARSQDRHNVAGAKSYAGDTKVLADLVRTDRHNRRPIAGDSDDVEAIKVLGPRQSEPDLGPYPPHQPVAERARNQKLCRTPVRVSEGRLVP